MVLVLGISLLVSLVASLPEAANRCPSGSRGDQTDHLPHPTDCSRYLTCAGASPVEQRCPDGLEWNVRASTCSTPDVAQCSAASSSRDAVAAVVKCPAELSHCPLVVNPSEEVILMPHGDCRKFYVCDSRGPIELSCPGGLLWNHDSCRCDYPQSGESSDCVLEEPQANDSSKVPHIRVRREDTETTTTEIPIISAADVRGVSSVVVLIVTMALNI